MLHRPWLAHYDADVPASLKPYPDVTLVDLLRDLAADHGGRTAVLFKGSRLTYAQLERASTAFAAALQALAVQPGDRVALLLPNCPQFMICEFGIWKAGGIVVALNPTYSEREIEHALESMRVSVVVTRIALLGGFSAS